MSELGGWFTNTSDDGYQVRAYFPVIDSVTDDLVKSPAFDTAEQAQQWAKDHPRVPPQYNQTYAAPQAFRTSDGTYKVSAVPTAGGGDIPTLQMGLATRAEADEFIENNRGISEYGYTASNFDSDKWLIRKIGADYAADETFATLADAKRAVIKQVRDSNPSSSDEQVWSLPITPQMKRDILDKGLPLMSVAPIGVGAGVKAVTEDQEDEPSDKFTKAEKIFLLGASADEIEWARRNPGAFKKLVYEESRK